MWKSDQHFAPAFSKGACCVRLICIDVHGGRKFLAHTDHNISEYSASLFIGNFYGNNLLILYSKFLCVLRCKVDVPLCGYYSFCKLYLAAGTNQLAWSAAGNIAAFPRMGAAIPSVRASVRDTST